MQKSDEKKILGTVPKKLQLVETFWDCPELSRNKQNQRGITLIALIITIIVMLILVGVTVNVALNGGLFSKAEEAGSKTKIVQIQEALTLKRAEVLADYKGKAPADYGITISNLDIPAELKTEYENKLIISTDGKLYYDASVVTNAAEQNEFKEMGIEEYVETNEGETYTFTLGEFVAKEGAEFNENDVLVIPFDNFWPEDIPEDLKNSTITGKVDNTDMLSYNMTCSDSRWSNGFNSDANSETPNMYLFVLNGETIMFIITDEYAEYINDENYTNYADLAFTITMAE